MDTAGEQVISNTSNAYEHCIIYIRVYTGAESINIWKTKKKKKKCFFFFSSYVLYEINAHNVLIATQILIAYPKERGGGLLRYNINLTEETSPGSSSSSSSSPCSTRVSVMSTWTKFNIMLLWL